MTSTRHRRGTRSAACVLAVAAVVAVGAGAAAAAGATGVAVSPAADSLAVGETTTVEVVVEDADGGVGALNATVTLSDPSVASVENVTLHGDPGLSEVRELSDGVALSAALADTDDEGSVTVATVVLSGVQQGETAVDVDVRALGDEDGVAYEVTDTNAPAIAVTAAESGTGDGSDNGDDESDAGDDGSDNDGSDNGDDGSDAGDDGSDAGDDGSDAGDDESETDEGSETDDGSRSTTTDSNAGSGDGSDDESATTAEPATDGGDSTAERTDDEDGATTTADREATTAAEDPLTSNSSGGGADGVGPLGAAAALALAAVVAFRFR